MPRQVASVCLVLVASVARAGDAVTENVAYSRDGGLLADDALLDIAPPATPGAFVRFTTDGTVPTEASPVWSGMKLVKSSEIVRARIFADGLEPGPVTSRQFLRMDATMDAFTSPLPVVVAATFGHDVDDSRDDVFVYAVATAPGATGRTVLGDAPNYEGRGAMHLRGHSSARFDQRPFAWETQDEAGDDADVPLLGMPEESDWVLSAPWSDKSLMRNVLAYSLMRELRGEGAAMRAQFVELFVDEDAAPRVDLSDYRGVYVLIEKIKRDKHRVNVSKLTAADTDAAKITGGYIFRRDKPSEDPVFITATTGVRVFVIEPDEPNAEQSSYIRGHVDAFEAALYGPDFTDPVNGYAPFIEADTFIDVYWFVEILKQVDGFRASSYFAKDRGGRIRALPIWDYDLSLGNASYLTGESPVGWYHDELQGNEFAWFDRLFEDPAFELAAWDRYWQLRRGVFSTEHVAAEIRRFAGELTEGSKAAITNDTREDVQSPVARHFRRWPVLGVDVWPNPPGFAERTTYQSEIAAMLKFAKKRLAWMDTQCVLGGRLRLPPRFSRAPGAVRPGARLALAPATGSHPKGTKPAKGAVWFTTDGRDPRAADGTPQGTAFTRPFAITAAVTVKARLFDGTTWGPLAEASYTLR